MQQRFEASLDIALKIFSIFLQKPLDRYPTLSYNSFRTDEVQGCWGIV